MKKIQKIISGVLASFMLFTAVPVNALPTIVSDSGPEIIENNPEIVETTETQNSETNVISDSTTENTPVSENPSNEALNEIKSDSSISDDFNIKLYGFSQNYNNEQVATNNISFTAHNKSEQNMFTIQVNCSNTNVDRTYAPGELQIKVDDPSLGLVEFEDYKIVKYHYDSFSISADKTTDTEKKFEFSYERVNPTWNYTTHKEEGGYFILTNNNEIKEGTNFTCSIQISCLAKLSNIHNGSSYDVRAYMGNKTTDPIHISLYSTESTTTINSIQTSKIDTYEGLGENPEDYYWVKYKVWCESQVDGRALSTGTGQIEIPVENSEIRVVGLFGDVTKDGNSYYVNTADFENFAVSAPYVNEFIVGYPKSLYSSSSRITQTFNLYGQYMPSGISTYYTTKEEYRNAFDIKEEYNQYIDSSQTTVSLGNFDFTYTGELFGITQEFGEGRNAKISYPRLTQDNAIAYVRNETMAGIEYPGVEYNLKVGNDVLAILDSSSNFKIVDEDNYKITLIWINTLKNKAEQPLAENKYTIKLYIRERGATTYRLYDSYLYTGTSRTYGSYQIENLNIVDYYIQIDNLDCSISDKDYITECAYELSELKDISETGSLYAFSYLVVDNTQGQRLNAVDYSSYNSIAAKELIASYDQSHYQEYRQRATDSVSYNQNEMLIASSINFNGRQTVDTETKEITQNLRVSWGQSGDEYTNCTEYFGSETYVVIPKGVRVLSTVDDIYNDMVCSSYPESQFSSADEYKEFVKENMKIEIIYNWNDSGQTLIYFNQDYRDNPLFIGDDTTITSVSGYYHPAIYIKTSTSFNDITEYGRTQTAKIGAYAYQAPADAEPVTILGYRDTNDINQNGNTTELMAEETSTRTIVTAFESYQEVRTEVQTDLEDFKIGTANSSLNSEYTYKLTARTGANPVTDLVLYDNLETAGSSSSWKGTFLGIDVSEVEDKGYTVKTYYSEKSDAGTLSADNSWKEYSESVNKTKVKSLAFKVLDAYGNSVNIPKDTVLNFYVSMKSPTEDLKTLAYNQCKTEWVALDGFGQKIEGIVGIPSNVVSVALPNSVKDEDVLHFDLVITKKMLTPNFTYNEEATAEDYAALGINKEDLEFSITLESMSTGKTYTGFVGVDGSITFANLIVDSYRIKEASNNDSSLATIQFTGSVDTFMLKKDENGYYLEMGDYSGGDTFQMTVWNLLDNTAFYADSDIQENYFKK